MGWRMTHELTRDGDDSAMTPNLDVHRNERGASLMEFAMVLPVLLTLLVGIVSASDAWNKRNTLEHAAREAARHGATLGPWDAAAEASVRAVVDRSLQMAGIDPADVATCIAMGADPCGLDPLNALTDDAVGVVLLLPGHRMEFVFFSRTVTLETSAAARYER